MPPTSVQERGKDWQRSLKSWLRLLVLAALYLFKAGTSLENLSRLFERGNSPQGAARLGGAIIDALSKP
jgi:hypothetical protein